MAKFEISLSRDGTTLAYNTFGGLKRPRSEVRMKDLASGEEKIFPMRTARLGQSPMLSPDGSLLSYRDMVDGRLSTFIISGDDTTGRIREPALSPDGLWISFVFGKPDGNAAIYVAPLTAGPPPESDWILLYEEDNYLGSPDWSPDGNPQAEVESGRSTIIIHTAKNPQDWQGRPSGPVQRSYPKKQNQ